MKEIQVGEMFTYIHIIGSCSIKIIEIYFLLHKVIAFCCSAVFLERFVKNLLQKKERLHGNDGTKLHFRRVLSESVFEHSQIDDFIKSHSITFVNILG